MSKLGNFDIRFITFVAKKYNKKFKKFGDYSEYLWDITKNKYGDLFKEEDYSYALEEDIKEFCKWQEEKMSKW